MHKYKNGDESGVMYYETGKDFIILVFGGNQRYLYNYDAPGKKHVEKMKVLAQQGKGLATYVSQHVKTNYAEKLN